MKNAFFLIHRSIAFLMPAAAFGNVVGGYVNGTSLGPAFVFGGIGLVALLTLPTHPDQTGRSRSDQQP